MELSDEDIVLLARPIGGLFDDLAVHYQSEDIVKLGRTVEAEVRKQDTELIRQLVEALEKIDAAMPFPVGQQAIKAARARLTPSAAAPRS